MCCAVNVAVAQISNQLQSLMSATPGRVLSLRRCRLYAGVPRPAREQSSESIGVDDLSERPGRAQRFLKPGETTPATLTLEARQLTCC